MHQKKRELISQFIYSWKQLKEEGVVKNQKDFTGQIAEWLIAELYNGTLAENGKQKDWDLIADNLKYQVKGHAKSKTSKRRDTDFNYNMNSELDVFVIVVFNEEFKLKNIFQISKSEIFEKKLIENRNKGSVILWSKLENYDILRSYKWNKRQMDILSIFFTDDDDSKIECKTYKIKIGKDYWEKGYLTPPKKALSSLPPEGTRIILRPRNKKEIICNLVNNPNKRILSNLELKDYIQQNFEIGDTLEFEMVGDNKMKILN
ncbi:hypothetical protein [Maribacter luteus]|uniref:hypothetical protein n=1 Tax=Maribacter luteus TaxID=2594478 RepID=UPI002491B4BB|nr:hypothetical protein [Maribacter luteus]